MPTIHEYLLCAARRNDPDSITACLEKGADINTQDETGRTPLHIAAEFNCLNAVRKLIEHGGNLNAKMKGEGTPLMEAVACGHDDIVSFLLDEGARTDIVDECEWSLLHWAASEDHPAIAVLLISRNPLLINMARWNGITPLHMVKSAAMTEKLISYGANIEYKTSEYGSTPLIEAAEQNQIEVVKCLIKNGANILERQYNGQSALSIAEENKHSELYRFINKIINPPRNNKGKLIRKHTEYKDNVTMAIACFDDGLNPKMIEEHARRRVDFLFYIFIAYYKTRLVVRIEETNIQHGKGTTSMPGCHSSLLTKLWDTERYEPSHAMNTRSNSRVLCYRTGILNHTDFEDSLNSTVQLHVSVNYFDTNYIEGRSETSKKMRFTALGILNQVSSGSIDPIQGMNSFMQSMFLQFCSIKRDYIDLKEELLTSPKVTRPLIYANQFKGTFFNACGFKTPEEAPNSTITLRNDYVQMILGSVDNSSSEGLRPATCSRDPEILFNAQHDCTEIDRAGLREQVAGRRDSNGQQTLRRSKKEIRQERSTLTVIQDNIQQNAYKQIKQEMDIPVQYQRM